ncbi:hypothetical protein [Leucobacter chinensis]|uniref:hypothetical protein n=1 Tax=Leucobacter chinensis TaxID=2851010 RepID=UPI001C24A34A|nr:hypothetical protein [Leucobacter chinensis]
MDDANNPYAAGGGGWAFETLVTVQYAAAMLSGVACDFGAPVERISRQTRTPGFDDIGLVLEPKHGLPRIVDIQCRSRQPFTGRDVKFQALLAKAIALVNSEGFDSRERALAVVVGYSSPAHREMADLCDLARRMVDLPAFSDAIARRKGAMARRWEHVLTASSGAPEEEVFFALRALHVRMADLENANTPGRQLLFKELSALWNPSSEACGSALFDALYVRMAELAHEAGTIDAHLLRASLGRSAPPADHESTRHERITRLIRANEEEIENSLAALGVETDLLEELAGEILASGPNLTPKHPITLAVGPVGIGKSTELRCHYDVALRCAVEDPSAPIPVFVKAEQFRLGELVQVAIREAEDLGDPRRLSICLFVDALDEAGYEAERLLPEFRALIAKMPRSSVVATSRILPNDPTVNMLQVPQLSQDEASSLIRRLRQDGMAHVFGREERLDLLCRPLFAIEHALNGVRGEDRISEAKMVDNIGRRMTRGLAPDVFQALVDLATKSVERGGRPVPESELFLAPPIIGELLRSRLVTEDGAGLRLQLAVLTEWFAGFAIAQDPSRVERTVLMPDVAWRWRYAHVQALLQATPACADTLMTYLVQHSPGTSAWIVEHASDPPAVLRRRDTDGVNVDEVKARLIQADASWSSVIVGTGPTGQISDPAIDSRVQLEDGHLTIALRNVADPPFLERENCDRSSSWQYFRSFRSGQYEPTGKWPWEWSLKTARSNVDRWLAEGAGIQQAESAQAELAFNYALVMLGKNHRARPDQVTRVELEGIIDSARARIPEGGAQMLRNGEKWSLLEGERFVQGLKDRDISVVSNPWPPSDQKGRWAWSFWSNESIKRRLEVVSATALDIYQEVVDAALPRLAGLLSTYVLLPATVIGTFSDVDSNGGFRGARQERWYIEPRTSEASNDSVWQMGEAATFWDEDTWAANNRKVLEARGAISSAISFSHFGSLDEIYSSLPASTMALRLLSDDLKRLNWSGGSQRFHELPALAPASLLGN